MYSGLVQAIPVPEESEKGKILTLKTGYVYWYTKRWYDSDKRRTLDDRVLIGKLTEDDKSKMYPNRKYDEIFGSVDPQVSQLRDFYSSKNRQQAGKFHFTITFGSYIALKTACQRVGCLDALQRAFPTLWKKIFAVCIHSIIEEDSTAQKFPGWQFENYTGLNHLLSDSEISRLFNEIEEKSSDINVFFELFSSNYRQIFPSKDRQVIAYDSTNQTSECKNDARAKKGKSKDNEKHPIINTSLYVDEKTGIPQWYEHYDGNVLDKTECPYAIAKAKELGFDKILISVDRGYYSEDVILKLLNMNIGFCMIIPETTDLTYNIIQKYKNEIYLHDLHYIQDEDVYGIQTVTKIRDKEFFAYVFYDDRLAFDVREKVHSQINYYYNKASERTRFTQNLQKVYLSKGLLIAKTKERLPDGKNFTIDRDHQFIEKQYQDAGYFVGLSNICDTAMNIIKIIRGRDIVEKNFMRIKSHFSLSRVHTHKEGTHNGKMFVIFIALITLGAFIHFIKPKLDEKSSITLPLVILELNKYKIQEKKDGFWMPCYAMNKDQKDIFKLLSLTEDEVEGEISKLKFNI